MKKIIAALDGLKLSISTQHFSIDIARKTNGHLTGVFLDDFTYNSYKIYDLITKEGVSEKELRQYGERDKSTRENAVAMFENACRQAGIPYNIHHDKNIALQELLHESIYADLLIIDSHETFDRDTEKTPTRFIRDLLPAVQCPVMLVPADSGPIEKIILLYNGEPSSVYAIKMFSYLLPNLKDMPVEVISVKGLYDDRHLPDNRLMKEFMKRHFSNTTFTVLNGHTEPAIVDCLKKEKATTLVVLGAYSRGTVSRWFRKSLGETMMQELQLPLFIAHNK